MKTTSKSSFWAAWARCFGRGLHAFIALLVAGFFAQVAVWATMAIVSKLVVGEDRLSGPIFETVLPIVCFVLIGLPLFGLLFSGAYSSTEKTKAVDKTAADVAE